MFLTLIYKGLKYGFVNYFENTSVHGFRYVLLSKTFLRKLLWAAAIVLAFTLCGLLISTSIREARDNPILSNTEEIPVEALPFPAFSLLAPKELTESGFERVAMDMIDACGTSANLTDNPELKDTRTLNSALGNRVRVRNVRNVKYILHT